MTTQVVNDVQSVSEIAERIKSDAKQNFPEAASVGDFCRQGDIYITLLAGVPANVIRDEKPGKQLAPGNTQGSRHCLSRMTGVTV